MADSDMVEATQGRTRPEGSRLFTSPEWRTQIPGTPPSTRVCRGPTRRPTMIVRYPPRLPC
eukprot:2467067-Pyramimonas_sp.AAC.1